MKDAANIFKAISDPTRRQILQMLKEGELSAGEISDAFDMAAPSVSRHLLILKTAGLIKERREGNRIIYSPEAQTLASCLSDFISSVCPVEHKTKSDKQSKRQR
jgi:DNA-binding transcriptional ArsR family regulator